MNMYGQISLEKLGQFVKAHPEVAKEVTFRDGHKEHMVQIEVKDRKEVGQFGDIAYIQVREKQSGDKAYIADLKKSKYDDAPVQTATAPQPVDIQYAVAASRNSNVQPVQPAKPVTPIDELPF